LECEKEENQEGMEFIQGRFEVCFWGQRETNEDLEKRPQGSREKRFPSLQNQNSSQKLNFWKLQQTV
jgi:hypothetical protein